MSEALMQEKGAAIPCFYSEPVENTFESSKQGRPIFVDQEFVKILIPGDRNSSPVQRVDDEVKTRWPKQYEAFKAGLDTPVEGTPLREWPPISRGQALEFAHFHVVTVEHLAALDDAKIANLGMGARALREVARTHLDVAKNGTGPLMQIMSERDRFRDQTIRDADTIASQKARIEELEAHARPAT